MEYEEEITIADEIKKEKRDFVFKNDRKPTMLVIDPYTAAGLKNQLGLSDLDEINSFAGMKIVYSLDESTFRVI